MKEFIKGKKYTHQEYMELSIEEMKKSISEHKDKEDPKVGAVLVDKDGAYFDKAHRGELRSGDHGEFTLLERKYPNDDLSGFTLYTTLEPCVKRKIPKKGCYKRCINARLKKVYIGHYDPDPTVSGNGVRLLENAGIEVGYYDKKYEEQIAKENAKFFKEASKRAEDEKTKEIQSALNPIENELLEFQLDDLSEQAQNEMINRMGLPYRYGTDGFNAYLNRMKLIKVDEETLTARPTGLGLLMLGKSPEDHFPQARIKLTIRKPNAEPIIKDFNGALILLPQAIEEYLEVVFPKGFSSRKSFNRTENVEASASAVYEVIMNAIVHRDYAIDGARIMIDITDESVVVSSPGKPICTLEQLNNFTAPSFSRNPKIAHIFFEMGFVEERGFGMEELSKFQNYGLPKPVYTLENNTLKTTLFREIDPNKQTIVKTELPGISLLREHKRLTTKQYAELSGLKDRQARNHLRALLDNDKATKDGNEYIWKE
ncbi:ATP-binding protein [Mariniflexile maritimum]|uniref:ATP-binding protein n=1 Tax=Mariniflexile maritimum TaxID=2682493 RepID=UPI0012F62855|nr:ATP-binding protein [Mariniflexile maritimum]